MFDSTTGGYAPTVEVSQRIAKAGQSLTPAERRVAEVVLERPQLVAFGTVAELAEQADVGAATVVRLASKLGYDGFSTLQGAVQHGLARQLRPAHERIRERGNIDQIEHHLQLEVENVRASLGELDPVIARQAAERLANPEAAVWVVSGDASAGVAGQFVDDLATLRDRVTMLDGNPVRAARLGALVRAADVVVVVDLRRYDRWVIEVIEATRAAGAWHLALTDRLLSPLAAVADATVVVSAGGGGPFDSHVGTLALFNLLVAMVADRLREPASSRLDRAEAAWRARSALVDG